MSRAHYFVLNSLHVSFCVEVCFWTKCTVGSLYFLTFCLKQLKEQQMLEKISLFWIQWNPGTSKEPSCCSQNRNLTELVRIWILIYHNYAQPIHFICLIKIIWKQTNKINSDCKKTKRLLSTWAIISRLQVVLSQRGCCLSSTPSSPHSTPPPHYLALHYLLCGLRD